MAGKHRDGIDKKVNKSVKVEPRVIEIIEENFGSFSKWVNKKISRDKKIQTELKKLVKKK